MRYATTMRSTRLAIAALALCIASCYSVRGSGHPKTEPRVVTSFDQVQISGGFTAIVVVGAVPSLTITADDNLLPIITSHVDHGQLRIRSSQSISTVTPVSIQITTPALTSVDVSGGVTITATNVSSPSFEVHASGGCVVTVGGRASQFTATLSGGVQLSADGLIAERARVDGSGGVRASVFASQTIDGSLSGGGMLDVRGGPAVRRVNSSGAAMVNYR
jgi:hypothetical protein